MNITHSGRQSFRLQQPVVLTTWASVAGKKESEGPLGACFDLTSRDPYFGQKSWEKAESHLQMLAISAAAEKACLQLSDFDLILSGDLLNQCIGSSFSLRNTGVPHLGLYGACSTMAESLLMGAIAVGSGAARRAVAMTSSHFASSERQYRFPLGYGGQRTPTAQWTVTGSGAVILEPGGKGPRVDACTVGTVVDLGIKDANNMGAAMAPAAYDTIRAHMDDLGRTEADFDFIITGDLGQLGRELLCKLAARDGYHWEDKIRDCGCMVFDNTQQDVHSGGSGCGCSAVVLCGYWLDKLKQGKLKRILFCGTGALLSPTSTQQGESIPAVCHAVSLEGGN